MDKKRKVEIFSAGCTVCDEAVDAVSKCACGCEISVLDMKDPEVASRAKELGVRSVPAVAIDGKLAGCCSGRGPDIDTLRNEGLGKSSGCCG